MNDKIPASDQTKKTSETLSLSANDWPNDKKVIIYSFLSAAIILGVAGYYSTKSLEFHKEIWTALIPSVLGSLLLVSLFVERLIEVFVSIWCDPQSAMHEQNRDYWKSRQNQLAQDILALKAEQNSTPPPNTTRITEIVTLLGEKQHATEEAINNVDIEEKALLPFEARTRKASTWIGLVIGIFTSAVGFRFLSQIVVLDQTFIGSPQYNFFVVVDVLLTGAVLAGGSKLIHQIFSTYEAFMESTNKSLSDKSKQ